MKLKNRLNQISRLLTKEEKISGFKLLLCIILMGVLDVLGVASILPFMSLASDPNFLESNELLLDVYNYLEFNSYTSFVMFAGLCVIILIVLSTLIKLFTIYATYRFTFSREHSISLRLFRGYLNQPYSWFLNQHSADLSRSVLADVREVVGRSILTTINVISNGFSALLIVSLLVMVDPVSAFSAFIAFGLVYSFLYLFVKKSLAFIGTDRLAANTARFKSSNETFSLIKEIKILGKENFYFSVFDDATKRFTDKETSMQSISALPRYFIEMVVFTAMISIVLFNLSDDFVLSSIIPILALYAFAAYRLIPSMQVIFGNITLFKASVSYLDSITDKYQELDITSSFKTDSKRLDFKDNILLDNISFRYPEADKDALSEIYLEIPSCNIIGIIGSTVSGKTTIVDVILGLLKSNNGGLYVDGTEIIKENVRQWQRSIGYVPQHISLIDESISANIALGEDPENLNMKSVISAAKVANIHDFIISDLKEGYETTVGDKGVRLSGGQRQRIGIARALYNKPDVLVLDEATSALDDETEQAVMDAVNNLGRELTIVIIAHRLSTLSKADIVYRLEKGRLHSKGSYEEMCKISGD